MQKFKTIPGAGRAIIVLCALGVFTIAVVACWTSYNAVYRLVAYLGNYGETTNMVFPLLLDTAFIITELGAILAVIMKKVLRADAATDVSLAWPVAAMIVCGVATIAFNIAHAYLLANDPLRWWRCVVAALPPVLMILSFQVLIAIVKWVMLRLGRPEQAFGGVGSFPAVPQMAPAMYPPSQYGLGNGQNGQQGSGGDRGKKAAILAVVDQLGTEEITAIGPEGITAHLAEYHGLQTTPNYVRKVLSEAGALPSRNGKGHA